MNLIGTKKALIEQWRFKADNYRKLAKGVKKKSLAERYLIQATVLEQCANDLEMLKSKKKS